ACGLAPAPHPSAKTVRARAPARGSRKTPRWRSGSDGKWGEGKNIMRATWTNLTDPQLLAQCAVDTYRASGPGGQKRNKTSSAVRLRHLPSGLIVIAEESRSQHENRARALRRLRQALFLKLRDEWSGENLTPEALQAC